MKTLELTDYIDWSKIVEDFDLETGDITPHQWFTLHNILKDYITQNGGEVQG